MGLGQQTPLTINIMTAALGAGDAIGNYMLTQRRIFQSWGVHVQLYADVIEEPLQPIAKTAAHYQNSPTNLLWYHYSIATPNSTIALAADGYKVLDYHGITPPELFDNSSPHKALCQQARTELPSFIATFDHFVVHTEHMRRELLSLGAPDSAITTIPLCIDTERYAGRDSQLNQELNKLRYLLFVGRIVPQKDILALLEIFKCLQAGDSDLVLLLVGRRDIEPLYQETLDRFIAENGLSSRVMFMGQINDPTQLRVLFERALLTTVVSTWESFCVPVAESAHFGTPVMVDDCAPLPEVAGAAGIIINKEYPKAAAQQVASLLNDSPRYHQLSTQARIWAQRYSDQALAENLLQHLQRWFLT